MMNAIHETDLLRWFTGQAARSVTAEINVTIEGNVGVTDDPTPSVSRTARSARRSVYCAPLDTPPFTSSTLMALLARSARATTTSSA